MPLTTAETAFAYAMQGQQESRDLKQRCDDLEERVALLEKRLDEICAQVSGSSQ